MIVVPKPNHKICICVDFTKLNEKRQRQLDVEVRPVTGMHQDHLPIQNNNMHRLRRRD